jgi:carboxyl-terminal processing protease
MRPWLVLSRDGGKDMRSLNIRDTVHGGRARLLLRLLSIGALAPLCACGGGVASTMGSSGSTGTASTQWIAGSFQPSSHFAAQCAAPRSGTDPITGKAYPDVLGSTLTENNWLRSWSNELYLWYSEIIDKDPSLYTTADYFNQLKTLATDAAGNPKDKFHFTYMTAQWESLSAADTEPGYGVQWAILAASPPRDVVVAYTVPNTPASTAPANLVRGAHILAIDGVDVVNSDDQASVATINAGLAPTTVGEMHTFSIQDPGATLTRSVTLQSVNVTENPVPDVATIPTAAGNVGYLLFNDHLATAEAGLVSAVTALKAANVTDLIIDIRYNGGGYLEIASELAYMVAGPAATAGQTFDSTQFNDKNPSTDPVTGAPLTPELFLSSSVGLSVPRGQALPTLGLPRVFVLTGPGTCSASEAVMNGLRGVGVNVIQIGTTTCGKPYGFYPQDNCGTTYFSIEFRGVNAQGFGDYPDGFTPSAAAANSGTSATLPGCVVDDDFTHALGDTSEALLAAALNYRLNPQMCPAAPMTGSVQHAQRLPARADVIEVRSPLRQNLLLRRP